MIGSCWDWPTLKYVYFVIENSILDAGGWSSTSGIVSKERSGGQEEVICLEDCLPTLPKESYFAGVGDFCIGVLFEKRDNDPRQRIDLDAMYAAGTPQEVKIVELIRGDANSAVQGLRENNGTQQTSPTSSATVTDMEDIEEYYPTDRSLWEHIVPMVLSAGAGFALYRGLSTFSSGNLSTRDVLLALGAGTALGITIGQEATRNAKFKSKLRR